MWYIVGDQCCYGLKTWDKNGEEAFAMKPTRFMSNCPWILRKLSRRCTGGHVHQQLVGSRGKNAAVYPDELQDAVCEGLLEAIAQSNDHRVCDGGVVACSDSSDMEVLDQFQNQEETELPEAGLALNLSLSSEEEEDYDIDDSSDSEIGK